jgi:hypothetical protein
MNILTDKHVLTRKPHLCWGCERDFPAGTTLRLVEAVDTEGFNRAYWCSVCQAVLADWHPDDCEYITRGDVKYVDPDIWEQYRDEVEGIK